jgi:mono/diheme cytochrome c family protein
VPEDILFLEETMKTTIVSLALLGAVLSAGAASAQDDVDPGQAYYEQYCATCHGKTGMGDGPMTEMMTTSVPDLTGLAAANNGIFPMRQVIRIIDGNRTLRAHGGPMPIYGALFREERGSLSRRENMLYSRGKLLSIAYYLETLQK